MLIYLWLEMVEVSKLRKILDISIVSFFTFLRYFFWFVLSSLSTNILFNSWLSIKHMTLSYVLEEGMSKVNLKISLEKLFLLWQNLKFFPIHYSLLIQQPQWYPNFINYFFLFFYRFFFCSILKIAYRNFGSLEPLFIDFYILFSIQKIFSCRESVVY